MGHSRDVVFALKCQIYTPPLCSNVYGVCCTTSPFCPRQGHVSCGLSCGASFLAVPAEGTWASRAAIGCDRPMSPRDCRAGCVCQALCSCRAQCQQWGLCLCCRKPDSAAKSSSCLQGLPEKPSAGIPLGWELLDRVTGLLHLCTEHGDRTPPKASPRGSRAPHCLRVWPKCKGLFSSLPYPGGLYLKLAETCGKTCWLPHMSWDWNYGLILHQPHVCSILLAPFKITILKIKQKEYRGGRGKKPQ